MKQNKRDKNDKYRLILAAFFAVYAVLAVGGICSAFILGN